MFKTFSIARVTTDQAMCHVRTGRGGDSAGTDVIQRRPVDIISLTSGPIMPPISEPSDKLKLKASALVDN